MSEPLVVPISRRKITLSLAAALVFVAFGFGLVVWDEDPADVGAGWAAIVFSARARPIRHIGL